jgi:hypothetical protein
LDHRVVVARLSTELGREPTGAGHFRSNFYHEWRLSQQNPSTLSIAEVNRMPTHWIAASFIGGIALSISSSNYALAATAEDAARHLERIKAVSSEGMGNQEAGAAWKSLVSLGVDALIPTLAGLDDAKPIAANWLRLAAQAIAENEERAKRPLPADKLERFVKDAKHAPASRRAAYELLVQADPKAPERLLPGMIQDPSVELRRDAIARAIEKATPLIKSDTGKAAAEFKMLLHASRDLDQAEKIAKTLKELRVEPDLNEHFGVLGDWMLAGPFDSTKGAGFAKSYEPETKIDLAAKYTGKDGKEVKWIPHASTETYGAVYFNKAIEKHKDAVA